MNVGSYTCEYGWPHLWVWVAIPVEMGDWYCECRQPHLWMWVAIPLSVGGYIVEMGGHICECG